MSLDSLPAPWQSALTDIAANASSAWTGIACLAGGAATVEQLVAFGAVELLSADPRYCTLTPWGAQALLGVELFEWGDETDPTWVRSQVIDEAVGDTPIVSRGMKGHARSATMDLHQAPSREWYADEVGPADPEPVRDEYDNEIILFAGSHRTALYRDDEVRAKRKAEAKARRDAKRAERAAKRRASA